tara:strand:+ start:325 stop:639 length:315 start_codon:yes stop_codon:yes gene_type:complete
MRRKKRDRVQVTCNCGAYEFPHRISGGRCSGADWAESYFVLEQSECQYCNCNHNGVCEVATGQESIKYCEGFREHLHTQPDVRHPRDIEEDPYGPIDDWQDVPF